MRALDVRLRLLHAGYLPLPCNGKKPVLKDWVSTRPDDAMIEQWGGSASNTGVLTAGTPALDIDVRDELVANQIEALVRGHVNGGGELLVRTGLAPKRLLPFRADSPFGKVSSPFFLSPDGIEHRVEVLGAGQQFVAHGLHPSGCEYAWADRALWEVQRSDLPVLTELLAHELIAASTTIMRNAGWSVKPAPKPVNTRKPRRANSRATAPRAREGRAAKLSAGLAADIERLVEALLPAGRRHGQEWKVGSATGEAGESLGVHLAGEKAGVWADFATGQRGDALDLVAEVKGLDLPRAMDWARDWLGVRDDPARCSTVEPPSPPTVTNSNPPVRAIITMRVEPNFPDLNHEGKPKRTNANTRVALEALQVDCRYDCFHDRLLVRHDLEPHVRSATGDVLGAYAGELSDSTCQVLRVAVWRAYGFDPGPANTSDAAIQLCLDARFDPISEYLDELSWDGKPRLDRWLETHLGAEDTAFNRAVARIALVAAVRRVRHPGCKFDQIIVLEGTEGTGKSTAILIMAGAEENFSDQTILGLTDREQQERLRGRWLYEIADLSGMTKSDVEAVKAFASRTHDRARPAYGKALVELPRRCVIFGTTNSSTYLKSETGNRRFWPVKTGDVDLDALRRDRDQLWAEAAAAEAAGEAITLHRDLWPAATAAQGERLFEDPWSPLIEDHVRGRMETSVQEILRDVILKVPGQQTQADQNRIAACLQRLGFEKKQKRIGAGRRAWVYVRTRNEGD